MKPTVTVVGSLNADLVIRAPRLPEVGETVPGGEFSTFPGGKGANQAVAAARLGADVIMVGCVGGDAFGQKLRDGLEAEGIDITHVRVDHEAPSGVALITVDPSGRNTIVVAPGANNRVSAGDVDAAHDMILASRVLLVQLEVPLDAVMPAVRLAHSRGARVILDPAPVPARPLPPELYQMVTVINPNEVEAKALTGIAVTDDRSAHAAAEQFLAWGCEAAVLKLGARGAFLATASTEQAVQAIPLQAVDTTAAGDAFAGALAVALAEGASLQSAVRFANAAGALSVTRMGAQTSLPRRDDVVALLRAHGLSL